MKPGDVERVLRAGIDAGAAWAEIFLEETRHSSLTWRDRRLESASTGTEYGVGVRLIRGDQVLYGHASTEDPEVLVSLVRELAVGWRRPEISGVWLPPGPVVRVPDPRPPQKLLRHEALAPLVAVLRGCDEAARSEGVELAQFTARALHRDSTISIWNSEGLAVEDRRTWSRATFQAVAQSGGERTTGTEAPGARQGLEFFEDTDLTRQARVAARRAIDLLCAPAAPAGEMPVVMGNGFGGVIFHEACGHPLETESLRRDATPFAGKIGELVAHPAVSAVDDGTIPGAWGSLSIDDEGMPTQRTLLIEDGILRSFLSDRVGAEATGLPRTGSARRESFRFAPVARMRNTFLLAGSSTLSNMLAAAEGGLYAHRLGGGSVNPATGEFNFAVEEGFLIRGGLLRERVRGATLTGRGHEILPRICMVGSDLELASGTCGASSGQIPVSVGQPTLLVDRILVGGR